MSSSDDETRATRSQSVSIMVNLLLFSKQEYRLRVVGKFDENEGEKYKHLAAVYSKIDESVKKVDSRREFYLKELNIEEEEEADMEIMSIKLEKGYLSLLSCAFLLVVIPKIHTDVGIC